MTRYFYSALLLTLSLAARAQTPITVDRNDMPNVGDTLRVSQTVVLPGPALSQTGPAFIWNYAALQPITQQVDRYQGIIGFPAAVQFVFGPVLSPNRATIATTQELPLVPAGLSVADTYAFFNESAADYRQVGYAGSLNGQPVPVTYQSPQLQDVVYRFPLTYQKKDSSNSAFTVNLPGTAFLYQKQKRVNRVDGAGTLITPFGSFATLRVVSTLTGHDSLSLGGQPGLGLDRPLTREYKWLGKNQGIPLLQVTTQVLNGQETVTAVRYRDIYRPFRNPLSTAGALSTAAVVAYPNPSGREQDVQLTLPAAGPVTLTATDLAGRRIFRQQLPAAHATVTLPAAAFGGFRGVVLLQVQTPAGVAVRRLVRE